MAIGEIASAFAQMGDSIASNITNWYIAQNNLDAQKAGYRLQRDLALKGMQIRVNDLEKAGLNKVLAVGGSMSAPAIHTGAPQLDFKAEKLGAGEIVNNIMGLVKMKADIAATEAQKELIDQQKNKTQVESYGQYLKNLSEKQNLELQLKAGTRSDNGYGKLLMDFMGSMDKAQRDSMDFFKENKTFLKDEPNNQIRGAHGDKSNNSTSSKNKGGW